MRTLLMAGVVAAASLIGTEPSLAQYRYEGPWCMHESFGRAGLISRCDMRSYAMCRAEMSARGGTYCTENPHWPGWYASAVPPRQRKAYRAYR